MFTFILGAIVGGLVMLHVDAPYRTWMRARVSDLWARLTRGG